MMVQTEENIKYSCSKCGSVKNVTFWEEPNEYEPSTPERKQIRQCRNCKHEKVICIETVSKSTDGNRWVYVPPRQDGVVNF